MNPEDPSETPSRLLAQIIKNNDHESLQNLHNNLNQVSLKIDLLKRFFSRKGLPEFESDWGNPAFVFSKKRNCRTLKKL